MSEWTQQLQTECALRSGDYGDPPCWKFGKPRPCTKCLRACGLLAARKKRLPMKEDEAE